MAVGSNENELLDGPNPIDNRPDFRQFAIVHPLDAAVIAHPAIDGKVTDFRCSTADLGAVQVKRLHTRCRNFFVIPTASKPSNPSSSATGVNLKTVGRFRAAYAALHRTIFSFEQSRIERID